jgi:L-aspartate oxidase
MTSRVGVLRNATGLGDAAGLLDKLAGVSAEVVDQESWETTNLLTISIALADAALLREETRGSHWREDFPERDDQRFAGHFDAVVDDGATTLELR